MIASLGGDHVIEFSYRDAHGQSPTDATPFADLPGVSAARPENGGVCLSVGELHVTLPALLARVGQMGGELTGLSTRQASLEDVFVQLAGRHLTDEELADVK